MDVLNEKIKLIEDLWKQIYETCTATPSLYTPHLPNLNVDEVGTVVLTVLEWMKSLDSNRKAKNTYILSKAVMLTTLNSTLTNLKNIAAGNYNYFPQFVTNLNQLLIALFPVTFLNSKDKSYANLSMDMAEELAKLKIMSDKVNDLATNYTKALEAKDSSQKIKENLENILENVKQIQENIIEKETSINQKNDDITSTINELTNSVNTINAFSEKIPGIKTNNEEAITELNKLIKSAKDINKTLEELLPGSTSAGLASSFQEKVTQLKKSKRWLLGGFIFSILLLSALTIYFFDKTSIDNASIWNEFCHNLPIIFPPIWLGWFFARSYGHATRLQEKYAYKEAMSKAFQGYRKQMEEVDINSELAKNLSELSLTILAENPSDVFERNCWDETPFHSLIGMILKRFKFGNKQKIHNSNSID